MRHLMSPLDLSVEELAKIRKNMPTNVMGKF